jgi:hypothetical protein
MPNHVKGKLDIKPNKQWNDAIREAQRQLILAKRRVEGLEKTVRNWTQLRDRGMPWPEQSHNQNQGQQHSV